MRVRMVRRRLVRSQGCRMLSGRRRGLQCGGWCCCGGLSRTRSASPSSSSCLGTVLATEVPAAAAPNCLCGRPPAQGRCLRFPMLRRRHRGWLCCCPAAQAAPRSERRTPLPPHLRRFSAEGCWTDGLPGRWHHHGWTLLQPAGVFNLISCRGHLGMCRSLYGKSMLTPL